MKKRPNAELQFTIKRIGTGSVYVLFNNWTQSVEAGPFYSANDATDSLIAASAIPGSVVTAPTSWVNKHPVS